MDERKSTSGYMFSIGSAAFSWSSKKQSVVALSSYEAEYIGASAGACQAIWLRNLMKELPHEQEASTKILIDNKSAIVHAKNPVAHGRNKHIETRYHFIRHQVKNKTVTLTYCKSEDQIADIFTKPLKTETFLKLKKKRRLVRNKSW